jgi:acyl transferase domain-containing protein
VKLAFEFKRILERRSFALLHQMGSVLLEDVPPDNVRPSKATYSQDPIAVIGLACRLPGNCNSPDALWNFLEQGGVAHNEAPESRFSLKTHHDGSRKPKTMRSPGGMFLENVDPQDFDAQFFGIPRVDAIAMDPQQRQLLEVVYECLENAGISLEAVAGKPVGCFVGSYAVGMNSSRRRCNLFPL